MWSFSNWRRRRILARNPVDEAQWRKASAGLALLDRLSPADVTRLRELAVLFCHEKNFEAAAELALTPTMQLTIALQACLPILNLGLDWYAGWRSVIVYPAEFVPEHEMMDEAGVVHIVRRPLSGEAWLRGPLIVSWEDAAVAGAVDGFNPVIHEVAHKLDMLNGAANGMPPLHPEMRRTAWTKAFAHAYADFEARLDRGEHTNIDPYAAEDPAEFFAVLSEAFFEIPEVLQTDYPAVYIQLTAFYRQHPAVRA